MLYFIAQDLLQNLGYYTYKCLGLFAVENVWLEHIY